MSSLRDIPGIGKKYESELNLLGINTIDELIKFDDLPDKLKKFQANAKSMKQEAKVGVKSDSYIVKDHSWVGRRIPGMYGMKVHVGTIGPMVVRPCRVEAVVVYEFDSGKKRSLPMSIMSVILFQFAWGATLLCEDDSDSEDGETHVPILPDREFKALEINLNGIPPTLHPSILASVSEVNNAINLLINV